MPFFEFNLPLPANYGSLFNYLYGFWLDAFLTAFGYLKLFSIASKIKVPKPLYVLMTFSLSNIFARSLGGMLLIVICYSLILYFITNRKESYNVIIFYFLISLAFFSYATSLTGPQYVSIVMHYFTKYSVPLFNYGSNILFLINFSIAYLVLTNIKMKRLIQTYTKTIIPLHPIVAWFINIFLISFLVIRNIYHTQFIKMSNLQYGLIGIIYAIFTILILKYVTRYVLYQQRSINLEAELSSLQVYTSHIEEMYDSLRLFRHDYKNLLLSLNDAISHRNIDQVASIYNRVILPTNTKIDAQNNILSKLSHIQSLEVKSLLFDKISLALEKGIKVNLEIEKEIVPTSQIDTTDMLRIISLILDNAINAAAKVQKGKINFTFFDDHRDQVLIVGNSTKEEKVNLSQLTKQSSRVLSLSAHGLGLRNLRQLFSRYHFIENRISSNNHYFEQTVIIHQS